MLSTSAALVLLLLVLPQAAFAGDAQTDSIGRGWYTAGGEHDAGNDNYCVGAGCPDMHNFFVLFGPPAPSADEGIVSATVSAVNPFGGGVPRPFVLHDVKTPISDVQHSHDIGAEGAAIYDDLGDGIEYGRTTPATVDDATIVVDIAAPRGLLSLNQRMNKAWAVGGSLEGDGVADFLFGSTSDEPNSSITLDVAFGPKTTLTVQAPGKVAKGKRVTVNVDLASTSQPCVDTVELELKVGGASSSVMTDASGHYSFRQRITKKTKISAFYPGDAACAPSQGKDTIKLA